MLACTANKQTNKLTERQQRHLQNQTTSLNFEYEFPENIIKQGDYSKKSAVTVMSDNKKYRVTLYSKVFPLPIQKIHSWNVHIETLDGRPVKTATIYIHGGMPVHRHGFPVKPRIKENLGKGNYLIKGVKFNMIGEWEMRINIQEPKRRDRAVFKISLK